MDFGTSHLSSDAGPSTKLDVKELFETRKKNAREDRALRYRSKILERAREVTEKSTDYEQRMLRSSLYDIKAKTQYLNALTPGWHQKNHTTPVERKIQRKQRELLGKIPRSESLPQLCSREDSQRPNTSTDYCASVTSLPTNHKHRNPHGKRLPKLDQSTLSKNLSASAPNLSTSMEKQSDLKFSTKNIIRKSRYIANSLKRIYVERQRRNEEPEEAPNVSVPCNTLQRAHLLFQSSLAYSSRPEEDDPQNDSWSLILNGATTGTIST